MTGDSAQRQAGALYETIRAQAKDADLNLFTQAWRDGRGNLEDSAPDVQSATLLIAFAELWEGADHVNRSEADFRRMRLAAEVVQVLLKRGVTVPPGQLPGILESCASRVWLCQFWLPMPVILDRLPLPPTSEETAALRSLQFALVQSREAEFRALADRISEMLHDDPRALRAGGTWSLQVLENLSAFDAALQEPWRALITHLLAAGNGDAPSKKWERQLHVCLQAADASLFLRKSLEWLALGPMPGTPSVRIVPPRDADYLKGFVWALGTFDDPAVARALGDLGEQCLRKVPGLGPVSARVGNACVRMLERLKGHEPVAQLGRLRTRVKYTVSLKLMESALAGAAAREGISPEELEEIAVPTFDLDRTGRLRRAVGDFVAEVRIAGTDDVSVSWATADGRRLKSVPAAVRQDHAAELKRLKNAARDIGALLPAQKARLERMLERDRPMAFEQWRARYPEHPLIGEMARRLIWRFSEDGRADLGIWSDGRVLGALDQPIDWLSPATTVRLWHPLRSTPELVLAWRRQIERLSIVQPFKQAHREIYVLTDAERTTGIYSNRFAAHILRQHQFAALCRERGWQYRLQGDWDSANTPVRRLPHWDLDVEFWVDTPADRCGAPESGVFQFICTDQVRFLRRGEPVRLEDVPAMAFSETMRDVDLFVGVCSVGNDATWADGGPAPHLAYWQGYSFGDLTESALTRRAVIAALIPKLSIADRLLLEDRFLVVRGDLASYRIHLGSGNVLMEPGSRYLCIVPARGQRAVPIRDIWLPFEGDTGLALILSKALMLAADTKITDPQILSQLRAP